jgi:hypothetical protein
MHINKYENGNIKNPTDTEKSSDTELNEKSEIKTYKFSRTLTIGGLVVSIILLIILLVFVYLHFYR